MSLCPCFCIASLAHISDDTEAGIHVFWDMLPRIIRDSQCSDHLTTGHNLCSVGQVQTLDVDACKLPM